MEQKLERFVLENFDAAMERGDIQPYFQPVIRTISRKCCSFEALARWIDPDWGVIRPDQFIPVLEKHQRIHELDACILRQVCARIRASLDTDQPAVPVSVNLSRLDFSLCDIFSVVTDAVSRFQIPHDELYIEITESIMAEQEQWMQSVMSRFRSAGFQVWMDDFGSGYSSLNILKDFTFDELKLDMRFLSSFDHRSRRILGSIINMAKEIEIHTLAEGVETEEQFTFLREIGCEKVQGFYFGRPLPYEETIGHLEAEGIPVEQPQERSYYDELGRINVLSALPFMTSEERELLGSARQLNSIPLALAEVSGDQFSLLFSNAAFDETAITGGLQPSILDQTQLRVKRPLAMLPARIIELMDSTRTGETGRMSFIANEDYYEVQAKCMARKRDAYTVMLRLSNLSKASEVRKTGQLDEGLRQIYTLFERITLLDLNTDSITPLFVNTRDDLLHGRTDLDRLHREYAERWIFPEDREDYLAFSDASTFEQRLREGARTSLSQSFRTSVRHGQYVWKQYTVIPYRKGLYLELIRNVHEEVVNFVEGKVDHLAVHASGSFPAEILWDNLFRSGTLRLFWKDRDRRFLGVNQAFLDYYGFSSAEEVLGRTDEELGWHVHPDRYMNVEERVIREGIVMKNIPGLCFKQGENREILASKMPLYDANGEIRGLLGYFMDKAQLTDNDSRGTETARRDLLTGLLNSRGIYEEAQAFQDEYFLRGVDFVRLHVAIDDFPSINHRYGFDFGDKAITALGRALKTAFGKAAAVGRHSGYQFVILKQIRDKDEVRSMRETVRETAEAIREIDGKPLTLYLSVGYSLFSELEDLEGQIHKAETCLLMDHDEHTSLDNRLQRASEIFRLYDELPISYAVYRTLTDEAGHVRDAVLFYVNHRFEQLIGKNAIQLLGRRASELFPETDANWFRMLERAGLHGETMVGRLFFPGPDKDYYMTASQVVRPGYCCCTYQELEELDQPKEKA